MAPQVELIEVAPTTLISVSRRARWSELSRVVPELLGEVWAAMKTAPLTKAGHNVAIYRDPNAADVEVECGVQVSEAVAGAADRVRRSETPSGQALHVVHYGPYADLGKAHDALQAFRAEHQLVEGVQWEVYGDWDDDPAKLRTDVYGLVTPAKRGR
jgi:effector-binding domain-containing protein